MAYDDPSRTQVKRVRCPKCEAMPGENCIGWRSKARESNHMERVHRYIKKRNRKRARV